MGTIFLLILFILESSSAPSNVPNCTTVNSAHPGAPRHLFVSPSQVKPKLFLLGAQKAGTSSLYSLLVQHPKLCGGTLKEPSYFKKSEKFSHALKGKNNYLANFKNKACIGVDGTRFVDGSTVLHHMGEVIPRMARFYTPYESNNLRFIILLREPVSRDISWFQHKTREDLGNGYSFRRVKTLKEKLEARKENEVFAGDYVTHLKEFVKYFRRDQLLIINSDMCFKKSPVVMRAVAKFLDIEFTKRWGGPFPHEAHTEDFKNITCIEEHTPLIDCDVRDKLNSYYNERNEELYKWLNDDAKPAMEPKFLTFSDTSGREKKGCVEDSRKSFDSLIDVCLSASPKQKNTEKCFCT